jgi:ATP-dependent Clp protease ATP-binding subunit ClpX
MARQKPICSFCGKEPPEALQFVMGPNVCICDQCVELCVGIIARKHPEWGERQRELLASLPAE